MAFALDLAAVVALATLGASAEPAVVVAAPVKPPAPVSARVVPTIAAAPTPIVGVDMVTTHLILRERLNAPTVEASRAPAAVPVALEPAEARTEAPRRFDRVAPRRERLVRIGLAPADRVVERR